jgi:molybdopterin synthase sulfur carrier subunit
VLTVRLFAALREAAGVERLSLELPAPPTVAGVAAALAGRCPALAGKVAQGRVLAAVNRRHSSFDAPVADGDEVAFFPPVSGG